MKSFGFISLSFFLLFSCNTIKTSNNKTQKSADTTKPNIVLCMADDQGWGDVAYNGHPHLVTPNMDDMAAKGLRFDRFYTAYPVCSPARAGFLTGRYPARMGSFMFGYSIRPEELTFPEVLQEHGYTTGHFGKWHVGTVKASSPLRPSAKGFDYYLSHDNFFDLNPEFSKNGADPTEYKGESSIILAEQADTFIRECVAKGEPFMIVIWFGSPHTPLKSSSEDLAHYENIPGLSKGQKNYFGEITGIDRALGKLRNTLKEVGVAENTLLFYTSDNGPNGDETNPGSAGGLKGRKKSMWEGGIREPGIIEWPARIPKPIQTSVPASTLDLLPTLLALLDINPPEGLPIDGVNILDLIDGKMTERSKPIGFWKYPYKKTEALNEPWLPKEQQTGWWRSFRNNRHPVILNDFSGHSAWLDGDWKLHKIKNKLELYNLKDDPAEANNIIDSHKDRADKMAKELKEWQISVELSLSGADFPVAPVTSQK